MKTLYANANSSVKLSYGTSQRFSLKRGTGQVQLYMEKPSTRKSVVVNSYKNSELEFLDFTTLDLTL
ncbi:hypothetical protein Z043_105671, partial [Scleropages formosus]